MSSLMIRLRMTQIRAETVDNLMANSPLGKYANAAALIASLGTLALWGLLTVFESLGVGTGPPNTLDTFAVLAIGVLLGTGVMNNQAQIAAAEKLNGQRDMLLALHRRLDDANIPTGGKDKP